MCFLQVVILFVFKYSFAIDKSEYLPSKISILYKAIRLKKMPTKSAHSFPRRPTSATRTTRWGSSLKPKWRRWKAWTRRTMSKKCRCTFRPRTQLYFLYQNIWGEYNAFHMIKSNVFANCKINNKLKKHSNLNVCLQYLTQINIFISDLVY